MRYMMHLMMGLAVVAMLGGCATHQPAIWPQPGRHGNGQRVL